MPRFFDDYSNTYLTHDSAAGRKQQRRGWKFRENFKLHYGKNLDDWRAGPMGLASAQQAYLRTRRNPATGEIVDITVPPLPQGWVEELDDATGVYFYSNDDTGERTWVRPDFRPPAPGMGPPPPFQQPLPGQFGQPPMTGPPPPIQPAPNMAGPPPGVPGAHFAPPPPHPGAPPGAPNFPPPPPPDSFPKPPS